MRFYLKKKLQKVEIPGEKVTSLKMFDVFSRICGQRCNERKTNSLWSKSLQLGCNNTLYHRPQRKVFCSCLFIFPTAGEQRRCAGTSQVAIYFTAFFHSSAPSTFIWPFQLIEADIAIQAMYAWTTKNFPRLFI